eukprot:scaffold3053_cov204-Alexandrium_tamarense.AAC.13
MGRPPLEEHPLEYQGRAIAVRDASPVPASGVSGRSGEGGRQGRISSNDTQRALLPDLSFSVNRC